MKLNFWGSGIDLESFEGVKKYSTDQQIRACQKGRSGPVDDRQGRERLALQERNQKEDPCCARAAALGERENIPARLTASSSSLAPTFVTLACAARDEEVILRCRVLLLKHKFQERYPL